jgi:DNA gyrase subunit A
VGSGVPDRPCAVAVSAKGYVRRLPLPDNGAPLSCRGGRGKRPGLSDGLRDNDCVEHVVVCSELDSLLLVGANGRAFHVRAGLLPEVSGKDSPGAALAQVLATGSHVPIANVLRLPRGDVDAALGSSSDGKRWALRRGACSRKLFLFLALSTSLSHTHTHSPMHKTARSVGSTSSLPAAALVVATAQGLTKRTALVATMLRPGGAQVAKVGDGDSVVGAALVRAGDALMLSTTVGGILTFPSETVTLTGRAAKGVIGMRVPSGARIASLISIPAATAATIPVLVSAKGADGEGGEEEDAASGSASRASASASASATSSSSSGMASLLPAVIAAPGVDVLLVWKSGGAKRVALAEMRMQARAQVGLNARPNTPANADDALLGAWLVSPTDTCHLLLDLGGGAGEESLTVADVPIKTRIQAATPVGHSFIHSCIHAYTLRMVICARMRPHVYPHARAPTYMVHFRNIASDA